MKGFKDEPLLLCLNPLKQVKSFGLPAIQNSIVAKLSRLNPLKQVKSFGQGLVIISFEGFNLRLHPLKQVKSFVLGFDTIPTMNDVRS